MANKGDYLGTRGIGLSFVQGNAVDDGDKISSLIGLAIIMNCDGYSSVIVNGDTAVDASTDGETWSRIINYDNTSNRHTGSLSEYKYIIIRVQNNSSSNIVFN